MGRYARSMLEFDDFQELEEFQQSGNRAQQPTRITQLERGRPLIRSSHLSLEGPVVGLFEMSHKVKFDTQLLPGQSVLILKKHRGMHVNWNGLPFPEWGVALLRGGRTYEILHESGLESIEITLPDNLLINSGLLEREATPAQLALSAREGRYYAGRFCSLLGSAPTDGEEWPISPLSIRQRVLTTCAELLDRLDSAGREDSPCTTARKRVRRAERIIEERTLAPPDLTDLADALSISPRTLQREFLKVLGITPKGYILARRLEAAKRALREGHRTTVADVSDRFGFSHPSRFAEHYKRHFGECPGVALRVSARRDV